MWNLENNNADESIYRDEMGTKTKRMVWWTQRRKERVRQIENVALKFIKYHV